MKVQQIGDHKIAVGGVSLDVVQQLTPPRSVDLVYTDPPWGPQALHLFDTMNKSGYQEWSDFLQKFGQAVDYMAKGPVFVFMGTAFADDIADSLRPYGFVERGRWEVEYGSPVWWPSLNSKKRLSATLWFGHRTAGPKPGNPVPEVHGQKAVEWAMTLCDIHAGDVVCDPCVGLGLVAKAAVKRGCKFVGSDLNSTRLGTTADILRRATGS